MSLLLNLYASVVKSGFLFNLHFANWINFHLLSLASIGGTNVPVKFLQLRVGDSGRRKGGHRPATLTHQAPEASITTQLGRTSDRQVRIDDVAAVGVAGGAIIGK